MIVRVAQQAMRSGATRIVVATDSVEVQDACKAHQTHTVMTRSNHPSGSDRLAEACTQLELPDDAIVVNVQGDEPLVDPALIDAVAQTLVDRPDCAMSTAAHAIADPLEWHNPNIVKVALDARQTALYFSRSLIPYNRNKTLHDLPLRHIGIYGYRVGFLKRFPLLAQAPLEKLEALEQLRALWHGERIAVHLSPQAAGIGVDTLEDLERVRTLFAARAML